MFAWRGRCFTLDITKLGRFRHGGGLPRARGGRGGGGEGRDGGGGGGAGRARSTAGTHAALAACAGRPRHAEATEGRQKGPRWSQLRGCERSRGSQGRAHLDLDRRGAGGIHPTGGSGRDGALIWLRARKIREHERPISSAQRRQQGAMSRGTPRSSVEARGKREEACLRLLMSKEAARAAGIAGKPRAWCSVQTW